ncbi:MAG: hypothetical protein Q4D90_06925 [bacterium]|nr:hypothetical protein [bacterium]
MSTILKSIHKLENKFDRSAERFTFRHPYLAYLLMFVGIPLFILMAVTICTMLIAFPLMWLWEYLSLSL